MYDRWDLSILYQGIHDPAYEADIHSLISYQNALKETIEKKVLLSTKQLVDTILSIKAEISELTDRLFAFVGLSRAVAADDGELMAQQARLMRIVSEGAAQEAAAEKILGNPENPETLLRESKIAAEYAFVLERARRNCKHLLADETEAMIAAMDPNGADAWGSLQSFLTSTLKVDYKGETKTLSQVRNLAYSSDAEVRKTAYESELAAYSKIEDSVAFALNNIKNQVTTLALKRGFTDVLDQTLEHSRMTRATLDAMLEAIREFLPHFRRYFRKKAKLLGHKNGLPWYDLFAPLGEQKDSFTPEEAKDYLTGCFDTLSPEMAKMMERAFNENWIDFYPRAGKEGGAFCEGLARQKQARILTNFDGTFSSVDTLAHELGHAYHDMMIQNELPLNRSYPMPIAETASTFNELHLGEFALSRTGKEGRIALLDSTLRETSQCIVDILCRYLFESRVFEQCRERFLMAPDLNGLMLECQRETYGDGLDPEFLNRGMWVCKSHYYMSGISFYNYPYAFGNLFAQGLYSMYKEKGQPFMKEYSEMLRLTGVHTIEENGRMLGIDLTDKLFWIRSLEYVRSRIDEFCEL